MIPMLSGASLVTEAYAPAKVRGIVNTQAQKQCTLGSTPMTLKVLLVSTKVTNCQCYHAQT